jgi:hypothetical protein
VLVLVLGDHPVDVAALQQPRIGAAGVAGHHPVQHHPPLAGHVVQRVGQARQGQLAADGARVLERVEHPRHLAELHRPLQVAHQPQLLEVGDVAHVPHHRAHQPVVLVHQLVLGDGGDEQQRALAGIGQQRRDFAGREGSVVGLGHRPLGLWAEVARAEGRDVSYADASHRAKSRGRCDASRIPRRRFVEATSGFVW